MRHHPPLPRQHQLDPPTPPHGQQRRWLGCAADAAPLAVAAGFGDAIEWKNLDEGLEAAKAENKLAMVVVHKSWCGACKRLGPSFAGESRIAEMADNFVMINVHDDEEPTDDKCARRPPLAPPPSPGPGLRPGPSPPIPLSRR